MSEDDGGESLSAMFDRIEEDTDGDRVSFGEIVDALGQRSFGSLFVVVSLLAILPTGAIPGMSLLTGLLMLIVALQLLFNRSRVWLPGFVENRSMPRDTLVRSMRKARGLMERIERLVGPRLTALVRPPFVQIVAAVGVVMALTMFPLALVPFGAFPASIALLVIGLGLTARDGLLIAIGIAAGAVGLVVAYTLLPI